MILNLIQNNAFGLLCNSVATTLLIGFIPSIHFRKFSFYVNNNNNNNNNKTSNNNGIYYLKYNIR